MSNNQTKNQAATDIPTWQERAAEANPGTNPQNWTARMKAKHMLDEIADLRAQLARATELAMQFARDSDHLAAKLDQLARLGQGSAKFDLTDYSRAVNYSNGTSTTITAPASAQPVATLAEHCESGDLIIWHGPKPPEGSKLYLAAPASAQPAPVELKIERGRVFIVKGNQSFMLDYAADEGDPPEEIEWYANQLRNVLSGFTPCVNSDSAQPDRGAASDEGSSHG